MKIRAYQPQDCQQIITLFHNTVHTINAADYPPEQLNAWAPEIAEINIIDWQQSLSTHYSIVVEHDNTIIGFGDLDSSGYFDRLYVDKDHQGQGVATIIANDIEAYALSQHIKLITVHASITAKTFFLKRHYQLNKQQTVHCRGQLLINFVMTKQLF